MPKTKIFKGQAFNEKDLFENFDLKSVEIPKEAVEQAKLDKRRKLCKRIFRDYYFLILQELIDNNICFELPIGSRKAVIKMTQVTGENFQNAYANGKFRNIDYLKTYFTAYDPIIELQYNTWSKYIPINWSKYFYKQVEDKVNAGQQYG